jgi:hypothetical protein
MSVVRERLLTPFGDRLTVRLYEFRGGAGSSFSPGPSGLWRRVRG